ncbi:MAG TPA: D-arabinono-1,4-lactone oxidase [Streptosporangiaceae bacterium]|nr:D-arabinono-1,4-lactone oxidase [Streptosporangiaceae bacterium]
MTRHSGTPAGAGSTGAGSTGARTGGTPAGWRNWAGNVTARPARQAAPRSADEVAAEVRQAAADGLPIRMTGTGHSFTPAAATDGVLLRPGGLTAIRSVDPAAGLVTVEAGCPLHVLNAELLARGLSLANMGDIQVQTVAGAIQTGTHGTGRALGGMAAQVAGLELVLADGRVLTCGPAGGGDGGYPGLFDAARVSVGALGIVTAVTFRVVPAFLLTAREEPMAWPDVLRQLDELTAGNEHFEFFWFPHSEGCLTKRNNRSDGPARPLPRWRYLLDDEFLSNTVFGLTTQLGRLAPATIPAVNAVAARALGARTYTDAACRVFTSPRRVRFKEQEYAVPRAALADILGEIRALIRQHDWRISFPVEVRVTPGDDIWLSTAYGRDSAYIAIHVQRTAPHEQYFAAVEAVMTGAGGRPHWGKMHTRTAEYLAGVYPRFADFVALRDTLDPERRFGNAYLTRVLGS